MEAYYYGFSLNSQVLILTECTHDRALSGVYMHACLTVRQKDLLLVSTLYKDGVENNIKGLERWLSS